MKLILLLLFIFSGACPQKGDSGNAAHQKLDSYKNRSVQSKGAPIVVDLYKLTMKNAGRNDETSFNDEEWASVSGLIVLVKKGGSETCNCHSIKDTDMDWHIELAPYSPDDPIHTEEVPFDKRSVMICEVSRYTKSATGLTYKELEGLKGKLVTITGYMFFDQEHKQNAYNTNPKGTDIWRGTAWEIHPGFSVIETKLKKSK